MKKNNRIIGFATAALIAVSTTGASAQEAAPAITAASDTSAYVFNSLLFLISGMVVMFMAAGFCMLEVGLVRSKNAATICLKNIALYSIAGIMVWVTGYNIIYGGPGNHLLTPFTEWFFWTEGSMEDQIEAGYSAHSDWYFQMVFVATAASIVSGTLAERIKLWPFLIFVVFLTGFIYPIQASWEWGAGFLDATFNFSDFAGSTLVHSTGGWAALAGALVLGPRTGKFLGNRIDPMPGSSLPLATLGTFILWLGWFGFNGGSQLAAGSMEDINAVGKIFVNTNTAAAAGVVSAMLLSNILYKKVDLTIALNGAIGGLVSITAEPLMPAIWQALIIGSIGGVIVTLSIPLLYRFKIDDVVGAIPAHLFCGIWGTLVVVWSNNAVTAGEGAPTFLGQLVGVLLVGVFVFSVSFLIWFILKNTIGIRVTPEEELNGLDAVELGQEAYPEFTAGR
ncbi:MAG: ammonium transporter [Aquisalinus sp.]|nr:ammonium transporter [Aquisalinus sp.]